MSSTTTPSWAKSTRPVCAPGALSRGATRASCTAPQVASSAPSAKSWAVVALASNSCCFSTSSVPCEISA
ncbi:hypothetical protein [Streptomyces sirii]|uniref:hypothetical protein n=1 Tax=Streptomyces sirii TaxID=3127701 RepID=UPI003D366874